MHPRNFLPYKNIPFPNYEYVFHLCLRLTMITFSIHVYQPSFQDTLDILKVDEIKA